MKKKTAEKKPEKKPSATQRTISMFTGKTDLEVESKGYARDGVQPNADRKPRRKPAKYRWESDGITAWDYVTRLKGDEVGGVKLDTTSGAAKPYKAFLVGQDGRALGFFANLVDASRAVEESFK